jgi:hypothetical protein
MLLGIYRNENYFWNFAEINLHSQKSHPILDGSETIKYDRLIWYPALIMLPIDYTCPYLDYILPTSPIKSNDYPPEKCQDWFFFFRNFSFCLIKPKTETNFKTRCNLFTCAHKTDKMNTNQINLPVLSRNNLYHRHFESKSKRNKFWYWMEL